MSLADTGIFRFRRWLRPALAAAATNPAEETPGHVYGRPDRDPGEATTALGRHRIRQPQPEPAPRPPDISLEQATRRIPLLERTLAALNIPEEEAVIYQRLAGGPVDEGPATDHTADAVRLPTLDQEGGESRD
jgi:hypothetical protein